MKILLTSVRLPHALGVIRALGRAGHEVYATDTFRTSPGLNSKYVKQAFITESPVFETLRFIEQLEEIIKEHKIDMLLPCFEEVFYIAKHRDQLAALTDVRCPSFESLAKLHNKESFADLTRDLSLPIAETRTVTSDDQLREAIEVFPEYFGRAAFSRGGVELFTNTGPLAGKISIDEVHPTPDSPWVVQEFVHGEDLCSFSFAHEGEIVAHSTYRHPLTIEHAGGIVFESVDEPRSLEIAQTYARETQFHGSVSFDYLKSEDDLYMVECNPRPCAGVTLMSSEGFSGAVTAPNPEHPYVVPEGESAQIDSAILRNMFRDPREIPEDLHYLFSGTKDVYSQKGDRLPGLYQILSYSHVFAFRHRMHVRHHKHSDLMAAQFFDIAWDGEEIK
ncbi:MAG: ATP-grasp domain-containing protein [Deltaproteobacteria bacterium]|nr:ATP-grasp domain-containing protein [Deltaproteobacteria bacterium]